MALPSTRSSRSSEVRPMLPPIGMSPLVILTTCCLLSVLPGAEAHAQPGGARWEVSGIPALNYDADEKFGYGAILQFYNYAGDPSLPYRLTIQPTVFLTTGGRREFTLFMDAPNVGGSGWRVDANAAYESLRAAPYYGIGNNTVRDETLEEEPNSMYYRYGRQRVQLTSNVQRRIGATPLRVLIGAGASRSVIDEIPSGTSVTLLSTEHGGGEAPEGWSNHLRAGLVWDTRDREVHTRSGTWADLLVQRVDDRLGSDWNYTRSTFTVRQYIPLGAKVTLAQRLVAQNVSGDAPFHDLAILQTSFKQQEGLGGAGSMRGIPKNRFIGKGLALSNTEVRWRAADFPLAGKPGSLTLIGFLDAGRVWEDRFDVGSATSELHAATGVGARVGHGQNFVVALDVGHSTESAASIYIGLGFLF
jgi:outer membrane protein assembly factor BamA